MLEKNLMISDHHALISLFLHHDSIHIVTLNIMTHGEKNR